MSEIDSGIRLLSMTDAHEDVRLAFDLWTSGNYPEAKMVGDLIPEARRLQAEQAAAANQELGA